MAKRFGGHGLRYYAMIVLLAIGKVQGKSGPTGTLPDASLGPYIDGSHTIDAESAVSEEPLLGDSSTEDPSSPHDRVFLSDTPIMDAVTIIWYVATFIALISFFLVMACADRNRCRSRKPADEPTPPPTPAPSYRQFAPPSYDSLDLEKDTDSIFIIPYNDRSVSDQQHTLASTLEYVIEQQPSSNREPSNDISSHTSAAPAEVSSVVEVASEVPVHPTLR
ncbi:uncharacterized protein LOC131208224 [Anopheles bellator]|uniref:uncharacterized protein LOC131208224 n=1 Tax=Anopheles bellator TaxID=139047 RepID=UPI002646FD82|nr:uncharacterized protein LOC131208224 [Anopheles bellator]